MKPYCIRLISTLAAAALIGPAYAQTVRTGVGANAAAIQGVVDQFRSDLGALNANGPCVGCTPGVGRREINWDAVPDASASPNPFAGNFFNQATGAAAGRIRGIEFTTMGTFEVSSSTASGVPVLFGNHSPDNAADFAAFSAERIFGVVGTNEFDVRFSMPGSPAVPALVRGFGAVFTDVELAGAVKLDFYDRNDVLLSTVLVPEFPLNGAGDTFKSFSFGGASFASPVVSRVHITNGGYDLALTRFTVDDSAALDDLIFGEPLPVPEPAAETLAIALATVAAVWPRIVNRST